MAWPIVESIADAILARSITANSSVIRLLEESLFLVHFALAVEELRYFGQVELRINTAIERLAELASLRGSSGTNAVCHFAWIIHHIGDLMGSEDEVRSSLSKVHPHIIQRMQSAFDEGLLSPILVNSQYLFNVAGFEGRSIIDATISKIQECDVLSVCEGERDLRQQIKEPWRGSPGQGPLGRTQIALLNFLTMAAEAEIFDNASALMHQLIFHPDGGVEESARSLVSARSAWCSGNAGIIGALLRCSKVIDSGDLLLANLLQCISRELSAPHSSLSATFCHGTSGVAHVLNRVWQELNHVQCRDFSQIWFKATIDRYVWSRNGNTDKFFRDLSQARNADGEANWTLLNGRLGVGLTLLTGLVAEEKVGWDGFLCLSKKAIGTNQTLPRSKPLSEVLGELAPCPIEWAGRLVYGVTDTPALAAQDWLLVETYAGRNVTEDWASAKGLTAVVTSNKQMNFATQASIVVGDCNKAFAATSSNFFDQVSGKMRLYGITGTKGKTTVCHLLQSILKSAGRKTGLITSAERSCDKWCLPSENTTPGAYRLHELLWRMHKAGATDVVLEVSSIAIAEERVFGLKFDALALTNIGHDHYCYHGSEQAYRATKKRFLTSPEFRSSQFAVCALNEDDPLGRDIFHQSPFSSKFYSDKGCGDLRIYRERNTSRCLVSTLDTAVSSDFFGRHNSQNIACAAAMAFGLGISDAVVLEGIRSAAPVLGRLEQVTDHVFVDCAHTPESVEAAIATVRERCGNKPLVTLLGCGGGTDRIQRTRMATFASRHSAKFILTSDNPGNSCFEDIVGDMLAGVQTEMRRILFVIEDRKVAIQRAVELAKSLNGVALLLGRGRDRAMSVGSGKAIVSDYEEAINASVSRFRRSESDR